MSETFKLPGSSYDEFVKILKAYGTGKVGQPLTLTAVAQTAGMDKTIISRNNGFLVQLSLISEGNKKSPTEEGLNLGRAYSLNMFDEIERIWRSIIEKDEFLSRMLSAIKIRNGMEKTSFVNHILYSSGSSTTNSTRAGANTIIEIYKTAKLIEEKDGQIVAIEAPIDSVASNLVPVENNDNQQSINAETIYVPISANSNIKKDIIININIDAKVEDLDVLSEKISELIKNLNN